MSDQASAGTLQVGFIPLADAAALLIAVDKGFFAAEGVEVALVREVSWSNVRDKLNIGLLDAAHLLAPVAIASSLGIGHVRVPIVAPINLGLNGNAITVSPALFAELGKAVDGDLANPLDSAKALARVVAARRKAGREPLTFGMTFPFSTHNYQLRFWMAAGGVDPDEDVHLVVLPPPFMVESLASGHVDGFCVGAPWNSVAVDLGIGCILHFSVDILKRGAEKVFAVRESWAARHTDVLTALIKALQKASDFIDMPGNHAEVASVLARPDRIGVEADVIMRTLQCRLPVTRNSAVRNHPDYMLVGRNGATRPDPVQAAWLYAQMVRWGQTTLSKDNAASAMRVYRPDLFDEAVKNAGAATSLPPDHIGAFDGPAFDPAEIEAYVKAFPIRRT
jgi:two-component system, oxyanion-binding sensor